MMLLMVTLGSFRVSAFSFLLDICALHYYMLPDVEFLFSVLLHIHPYHFSMVSKIIAQANHAIKEIHFVEMYYLVLIIFWHLFEGTRIPKVIKIDVSGDLAEGNTIKGYAEVAWCGGTPGKGVAR